MYSFWITKDGKKGAYLGTDNQGFHKLLLKHGGIIYRKDEQISHLIDVSDKF